MSPSGVRRDKAALSSGCKSHPASAPAGSNRSSYGGNEIAEAFGKRVTKYGDGASVQAVTRVNAEQASKRTMRRPTRQGYRGRLTRLRGMSEARHPAAAPGQWRQHVHKESERNTGDPKAWTGMTNRMPVRDRPGALGSRRGSWYRGSRVMPVEGRDLSSRRTQYAVRDLEIG